MWGKYLHGIRSRNSGSRWLLPFLLAFSLFSASLLSGQGVTTPNPQTPPSDRYSKMTPEQLRQAISDKDKLLDEWLTWQEKEKTSQAELAQASTDQIASRDRLIADQRIVITAVSQERDNLKGELDRQAVMGWLERLLYGLGGLGLGYAAGHFTK